MEEKIRRLIEEYENKKDVLNAEVLGAKQALVQCELMIIDLKNLLKS